MFASKRRVKKQEAQEKAYYDYKLAELTGRSIARAFNSSNTMPEFIDAYSELFDKEEIQELKAAKQAELFTAQLRQFASFHNKRIREVANKNE